MMSLGKKQSNVVVNANMPMEVTYEMITMY